MIVDFLIHLREDKGFSLSALKGYRSTINLVFTLKGMNLANSKELSMLFRSFTKTCSPQNLRPPAWDVALVLQSLTNQPYEPIREAEERFLAQKTLFLIALTSAKRVGELHALSYRVSHATYWKEVSFSFVPGFVAKTQDQSSFDPRFENFTVPALPKSSSSPNGRLLCPVQAVKRYLDRTAQHRPRCERLFITSGRTKEEISKNTVSFWLRKVISLAYQLSGKPLPSPSPLARETRDIAPSLLFKKKELRRQPGSEGRYVATSHHIQAPLPPRLVSQVTGYFPPGSSGGGTGHGIAGPDVPEYPNLVTQTPVTPCPVNQPFPLVH